MPDVPITTTPRGFYTYGPPLRTDYGHEVTVRESSSAMGRFVWLFADGSVNVVPESHDSHYDRSMDGREVYDQGHVGIHLSVDQAQQLVARLQVFIDQEQPADTPALGPGDG